MTCWPTTSQLTRELPKAEYIQSKNLVSAFGRSLHSCLGVGQCIIGQQLSHEHEKILLSESKITHFANGVDVNAVLKSFIINDGVDKICQSVSIHS